MSRVGELLSANQRHALLYRSGQVGDICTLPSLRVRAGEARVRQRAAPSRRRAATAATASAAGGGARLVPGIGAWCRSGGGVLAGGAGSAVPAAAPSRHRQAGTACGPAPRKVRVHRSTWSTCWATSLAGTVAGKPLETWKESKGLLTCHPDLFGGPAEAASPAVPRVYQRAAAGRDEVHGQAAGRGAKPEVKTMRQDSATCRMPSGMF